MSSTYLVLRNGSGYIVCAVKWEQNGFEVPFGYWFDDVLGAFSTKSEATRHALDLTAGRVEPVAL